VSEEKPQYERYYQKTAESCLPRFKLRHKDYTLEDAKKLFEDLFQCQREKKWYRMLWHEFRVLDTVGAVMVADTCLTYERHGKVCSQDDLFDDDIVEIFIGELGSSWVQFELLPTVSVIRSVGLFRDNVYYRESTDRKMFGDAAVDETIREAEAKAGKSLKIQFGVVDAPQEQEVAVS
jgi:hypothetical protein